MSLEWGGEPAFETDEERREAWEQHCDRLMAQCDDGWRPQAWWDFDAPFPRPRDSNYAKAALWEAGLLFAEEAAMLEARWREKFDRAQAPDFQFCTGHDPKRNCAAWLNGDAARRAHYRWAGIPHALIKRWSRQRGRTLRRLANAPAPSPAPEQPPP
jgi:hypothetical protein